MRNVKQERGGAWYKEAMNRREKSPWTVSRRDFLKATGAALAGAALTGAGTAAPVRFGLIADCHYADRDPAGTRHYRDSLEKLAAGVGRMNEQRVDFAVELGDFKDQDAPPVEAQTLGHLRRIESAFRGFNKGPRYHVLGNHDMDSISKAQFLGEVENTGIAGDRSFYSFDLKGLHGVVLDANFSADGTDYDHGRFDWKDANVPAAQIDWLRDDLAAAPGPAVVFVHQRLDGEGDMFVRNAEEVRGVLEASGKVLAVFQGHHHAGGYTLLNGIHYYTLRATVEGPGLENNAYAVAELHPAGDITVTGYGQAVSRDLPHSAP